MPTMADIQRLERANAELDRRVRDLEFWIKGFMAGKGIEMPEPVDPRPGPGLAWREE